LYFCTRNQTNTEYSMRILILCDPFHQPSFSPRLRYLCDFWLRSGHTLRVITEQADPIGFAHAYPIDEVMIYHHRFDWFIKAGWSLISDWKNRYFTRRVRQMIVHETYDLVFVTTFSTFPLRAGAQVAQSRHIPLYVDIRDVDEQVPNAQYQAHRGWWARPFRRWYQQINIRRRNRVLRQADRITTVSPWHVDFLQQWNPNVHLVYNGYDPNQFYPSASQPIRLSAFLSPAGGAGGGCPSPQFLVSYIGRIYDFQHADELWKILQSIPGVELNIHTPQHHPISIDEVGDEIRRSSVMVVLTDPSAKGLMTTKFFEALGCEKPVLCYPSDNGLLAQTIEQTHAGIATDDPHQIRAFIAQCYEQWQRQGYTHQDVVGKEFFSREYQSGLILSESEK